MSEESDFQAAELVARFLGNDAYEFAQRIPQGLSGGSVYRCRTRFGLFALKRWPDQASAERIGEVHRVQQWVAQQLPFVPRLINACPEVSDRETDPLALGTTNRETILKIDGAHFELSTWMPGKSWGGVGNTGGPESELFQALRLGADAIGRFHRQSEVLGRNEAIAPAVIRRIERLNQLQQQLPEALSRDTRLRGAASGAVELLAKKWRLFHQVSEAQLSPWLTRPVPTSWVLRDVHREHILFEGGQVTGMVDFDAVNQDTTATDLARWVGSFADFGHPTASLWNAAMEGYTAQHTITPCEQELAGAIEEASWYIQLANWVIWTSKGNREIPGGLDAAERRVAGLLRRNKAQSFCLRY
jgi:Ser/Thr protein kinase RdoA (MazF antagonist)